MTTTTITRGAVGLAILGLMSAGGRVEAAIPCLAGGPTFNLQTGAEYISEPDGDSILMWSYVPGGGVFQYPSAVLCVNQGDTVTINLTNTLAEPVSIIFPGQVGVVATGGVTGLFTQEAAAAGGTVSYSFVAAEPGTYLYESGTMPHRQVQMGLYGAIIVRPALGANFAYNDPATQFNPAAEYLLLMHDIDHRLHMSVQRAQPYDVTRRHDTYWTLNGRSFPDTINSDGVPWLPNQPYGSLVTVQPYDAAANPLPALVRYANAGWNNHPFHPHGNNLRIIATDGRLLASTGGASTALESFATVVGSGQTYDLLATWYNEANYSSALSQVPVELPGPQLTVYKDNLTWYGGSPYLGEQGQLPPTVTSLNQCGEYYFPWHSHALYEFANFDEGFGGLATLWRVDPPGGCPPAK